MKPGIKAPDETIRVMREMCRDGYHHTVIAKHCGVSASCVQRWTKDIQIERPTPLDNRERNQLLQRWR